MKPAGGRIIVVAEDRAFGVSLERLFPRMEVVTERSIDRVLERCEDETYDVLPITSVAFKAGEVDGVELTEVITTKSPATQILFLVEKRDIEIAKRVLEAGAYRYVRLPIGDKELRLLVETALEERRKYSDHLIAGTQYRATRFEQLVGKSAIIREVYRQIRQAAATDIPVLLEGETGTGKDLAAKAVHRQSDRRDGPFVPVNLGALPPDLVASDLFGRLRRGRFAAVLVDRDAVLVDVLELMLNVRDIDADLPVVVVGKGSEDISDEAFLALPGATMIGGADIPEKLIDALGEALSVRKTQDG